MPIIEGSVGIQAIAAAPTAGVDEVQLLTYTAIGAGSNVAASGTFKVSYEGFKTTALAFNISAANLTAALVLLPSIGAAGVSSSVAAGPPRVYTVTFGGGNMLGRSLPLMTIVENLLLDAAGLPVNVVVSESVAGVSASGLGAAKGALLTDTANGVLYINTGTALAPVWTKVGTQA